MVISKSEYMMFLKHPAWLWLKKHDKEKLPEPDASLQALFDEGNLFEGYAEKLFPDGVRIGFENYKEYLSLPKRTDEILRQSPKAIFQGRFEVNNTTCIIDVLQKVKGNTFDLYEIKSSTKVKPEHEYDLAFQVTVLEESGLTIRNISVIHVNNQYVRKGDIDIEKISAITDITEKVREKMDSTKENIKKAHEVVALKEIPDMSPRYLNLGTFKEWMEIYQLVNGKSAKYSIYDLCTPSAKRIGELEDKGIELISDIPNDFNLTPKQHRQAVATKTGLRHIDKESISSFLDHLKYPLYFLDYETFSSLIPAFDGVRPYQQVPFQYSVHILKNQDSELEHGEYLHTANTHPGEPLLKKLREDIGNEGSIIVWYEGFEKSRNKEMADAFPEYQEFLAKVNDRIVDLMIPFSNGWFVDKDFLGSASIKNVLPVVIPELSYDKLTIKEGVTAQRTWVETILEGKNADEKDKIMDDLIKYCKLDTLAMVKIFEYLKTL